MEFIHSSEVQQLLIILLVVIMALSGCYQSGRRIQVSGETRFVEMFGKYNLELSGGTLNRYQEIQVACRVTFKERIPDTVDIGTIPILRIQSLCFQGDCLSSDSCYTPRNTRECDHTLEYYGLAHFHHLSELEDIYRVGDGYLHHVDFFLYPDEAFIPKRCKGQAVKLTIHAYLIDPVEDSVIARESKDVELLVIGI